MDKKGALIKALAHELLLRKKELKNHQISSIYFGGGTPSLLAINEIAFLIETIRQNYTLSPTPEITLEANPDDLTETFISALSKTAVNRLSIGIQSFFEDDLRLMNRAHTANESKKCLEFATQYFNNITIDLIYGVPNMSLKNWEQNLKTALNFGINHISAYALTVEEKTALQHKVTHKKISLLPENEVVKHFELCKKILEKNGFIHYELSNYGKEGFFSQHNSAYWLGKKYMGVGPSAHSFNGTTRSWNVANNIKYIHALETNTLPQTIEILSQTDQFNEALLIGLRTQWGINLTEIETNFGNEKCEYLVQLSQKHIEKNLLIIENNHLKPTEKGMFIMDGIIADLFWV